MAIQSAAGSKFSLSAAAPATYTAAGFAALTFTEVGEVTQMGDFGKTYATVTHNPLSDRKTYKLRGSYNNGSLSLSLALDTADAGQDLAATASESDTAYSIKIELQDGTIFYTTGLVMSFVRNVGTVDTVVSATVAVELVGDLIED